MSFSKNGYRSGYKQLAASASSQNLVTPGGAVINNQMQSRYSIFSQRANGVHTTLSVILISLQLTSIGCSKMSPFVRHAAPEPPFGWKNELISLSKLKDWSRSILLS